MDVLSQLASGATQRIKQVLKYFRPQKFIETPTSVAYYVFNSLSDKSDDACLHITVAHSWNAGKLVKGGTTKSEFTWSV